MTQDEAFVVLLTPATSFEARVVLGVLESSGIQAFGPSGMLMDEVAMSQALMNSGTEIRVRAGDHQAAESALARAKEAGELLDREDFDPGSPAGS